MIKKIFDLSLGVGAYQVASLVSLPILASLYGFEALALFGIYGAVFSIVSVFSTGRLHQLILIAQFKTDRVIFGLCALLFLVSYSIISFLIIALIFFLELEHRGIFYFIPLSAASFGLFEIISSILISKEQHKKVSLVFLCYGSGVILFQFFFYQFSSNGLILGKIAGDSLLFVVCAYLLFKYLHENRKIVRRVTIPLLIKYIMIKRDFYLFGCSQGFLNSLSRNLLLIVLPLYNAYYAGIFVLFYKFTSAPVDFIAKPLRQVLLASSNFKEVKTLISFFHKSNYVILSTLITLLVIYYMFNSLGIISYLEQMNEAFDGLILLVLILPWLTSVLLFTPIKTEVIRNGSQKLYFGYEIIFSLMKVITCFLFLELLMVEIALSICTIIFCFIIFEVILSKILLNHLQRKERCI